MAIDLLEQILPHIKEHTYPLRIAIPDWKMKEGDIEGAHQPSLKDKSWLSIRVPFDWGRYDKTFWFRQTVSVPSQFAGKPLVLLLDFPEALCYVDGKAHQGIDAHHQEVLLVQKSRSNQPIVIAIQAYSGRKKEHSTFGRAELAVLNPTARALYHALSILHELDKIQEHSSQESRDIRELIRRTLIFLKYFKPEGEEYPNAISRAYNFLVTTLEIEFKTSMPGLVHLVAHSYIDVVWLWTLKETIRKCGRTFSTVLRLMEEFPEFKFAQGQVYLYELTRQHYPDIYKQIKLRVSEGRWDPIGSMWVETDCNIPNGESLVRQVLYGKRFLKNEFGVDSEVAWLPETFGYTWSLPQILKKSGVNYFFGSILSRNDTNRFPYSTFWWQGIDGTKILAHIPPVGLDGLLTPMDIKSSGAVFEQEGAPGSVLQTFGYGDGGGGPTKEHIQNARVLKTIISLPTSQLSTIKEFFTQAEQQAESLPAWEHELYLEKHRGTYSTNARVKKDNRECELLLYRAELLAVLGLLYGKSASSRKYPQPELESAWKKLLVNQFHHIVAGTAIADVYNDVAADFAEIHKMADRVIHRAVDGLTRATSVSAKEFSFALFNPLGWTRSEYVQLEVKSKEKHFAITDSRGQPVEHQVLERAKGSARILCYVENVPAFSFLTLTVKAGQPPREQPRPWKTSTHIVETPLLKLRFDNRGALSSMYDKGIRRELIQKGRRGNYFQVFLDTPKQWDAWDIDPDFEKHKLELLQFKHGRVLEEGPLRATIRIEYRTENNSVVSQDVRMYHKTSRVDFETRVKWLEKQTLLKVAFPLNLKASSATYEIQFGALKRPTRPRDGWEKAKFEVPAQQWADLSDAKFGVSLLNDAKYGYDAKENVLRLTLLRSPFSPHPLEPGRLNDSQVLDQGEHRFTYSVYPHAGDWKKGETTRRARELNNPFSLYSNSAAEDVPSIVEISKTNIIVDSVKKAEDTDDPVLRLHEAHGDTTDTTVKLGFNAKTAFECDLMENALKEVKVSKGKLSLRFKPFEIKTLKIELKSGKKK